MSDQNKTVELEPISKEMREIAAQLIIAKGVDYNVLPEEIRIQKEREILEIYFGFIEQVLDASKNLKLAQEWQDYKSSGYSSEIYNSSKHLEQAFQEISKKFLEL